MQERELVELIETIQRRKTETNRIEFKKAKSGAPETLYDTLSSFSNTEGGIILFGIDEKNGYVVSGVEDIDNLEKKIVEQANAMSPVVRPLMTVAEYNGKIVLAAEIPELDAMMKPCFYLGKGKNKGSYIRVGDADLPMTEYEIYNLDSFKYRTEDELRTSVRYEVSLMDENLLNGFVSTALASKPNLANLDRSTVLKMNGLVDKDGNPTICGILLFGSYPQFLSPNLDVVAVACPTENYAEESADGERFLDSARIDGTIVQMLDSALSFVRKNMKVSTVVDENGLRNDVYEYPMKAVREVILNALVHRDYSIHTENIPIHIAMYPDRLEVSNPGGLYGRLTLEQLGKSIGDVRNPFLVSAMELLQKTENRFSGIPTIYREMEKAGLLEPKFEDERGTFRVTLFNRKKKDDDIYARIIDFCRKPRSRGALAKEFGFDEAHPTYFINNYVVPLIKDGKIRYMLPEKPRSKNQQFVAV